MDYYIDLKSIIKEVKSNEDTDSVEQIKKRIKEKINIIILNYNKYFAIDFGFNMMKMALILTYDNEKERLETLEKYLDGRLSDYLNNSSIQSIQEM